MDREMMGEQNENKSIRPIEIFFLKLFFYFLIQIKIELIS